MDQDPSSALAAIGNTPLIELHHLRPKPGIRIFAKLEGQNPSGSIKDRIALRMVCAAEKRGDLKPGDTIVEASSGNTAIALALVARQRGYNLQVALPEGVPPTIVDILELLEVELHWCPPKAGMKGAIDRAEHISAKTGSYPLRQFFDPKNVEVHYQRTGAEIVQQLPTVDVFIAGIGTGGTVMGVGRRLREHNPKVKVIGIEPRMGERLQGLYSLEDTFLAPLLDLNFLDRRFLVGAGPSIERARQVAAREGVLAGVSAGATLHVALRIAEEVDKADIVAMFSDGGWKYLPSHPWNAAQKQDPELDEIHWW